MNFAHTRPAIVRLKQTPKKETKCRFLIERNIPGAGDLTPEKFQEISAHSCSVIDKMNGEGKGVKWLHSHVTPDKIFCVYEAPDEKTIREHAQRGGFPADNIFPVKRDISPKTAKA